MKYVMSVLVILLAATASGAQTKQIVPIKIVVPSKTNEIISSFSFEGQPGNPIGDKGNCYSLAVMGARIPNPEGAGLRPGPITQADISGLQGTHCVELFYSQDQTDQLLTDHDVAYQKKLDDVKRDYVDKISSLSPEVLAAIKDEVKQQLMAELVPQIREEVKRQINQEKSATGGTSNQKAKTKPQQSGPKPDSKPATPQK